MIGESHEELKGLKRAAAATALIMWAIFAYVIFNFDGDPDYLLSLRIMLVMAIVVTAFNIFLILYSHVHRKMHEQRIDKPDPNVPVISSDDGLLHSMVLRESLNLIEQSERAAAIALLMHVSNLRNGADVSCAETASYIKGRNLTSLDSALLSSDSDMARSLWRTLLKWDYRTREIMVYGVRSNLEAEGRRTVRRNEIATFAYSTGNNNQMRRKVVHEAKSKSRA